MASGTITDDGEEVTFLTFLRRVADDPADYAMYFYDDLPRLRDVPLEWEPDLIAATQFENIKQREQFLFTCSELLIALDSQWSGLPGLLTEVTRSRPGLMTYSMLHTYAKKRNWFVPTTIAQEVVKTFEAMPAWKRAVLWLDQPCRDLVRRARNEMVG